MSDDTKALIAWLRMSADVWKEDDGGQLYTQAADTIARLEAERDAARESDAESLRMYRSARDRADAARQTALEECARMADEYATWGGSNFAEWFHKLAAAIRAAMKGER